MMSDRLGTTVLTMLGSLAGHHGGDYLVQKDRWTATTEPGGRPLKQQHNPQGRRALAAHAGSVGLMAGCSVRASGIGLFSAWRCLVRGARQVSCSAVWA